MNLYPVERSAQVTSSSETSHSWSCKDEIRLFLLTDGWDFAKSISHVTSSELAAFSELAAAEPSSSRCFDHDGVPWNLYLLLFLGIINAK